MEMWEHATWFVFAQKGSSLFPMAELLCLCVLGSELSPDCQMMGWQYGSWSHSQQTAWEGSPTSLLRSGTPEMFCSQVSWKCKSEGSSGLRLKPSKTPGFCSCCLASLLSAVITFRIAPLQIHATIVLPWNTVCWWIVLSLVLAALCLLEVTYCLPIIY